MQLYTNSMKKKLQAQNYYNYAQWYLRKVVF